MKKRLISILLALCMVLALVPGTVEASDTIASGMCGTTVTWKLDSSGVLTIDGTGAMADYTADEPWKSYRSNITSVIVQNGVTRIGEYAFYACKNLLNISIANTVTHIGHYAFLNCEKLGSLSIPNSVKEIGEGAFTFCYALTTVNIPASVTYIGDGPFTSCKSLSAINVDSANPSYVSLDGVLYSKNMDTIVQYPIKKTGSHYSIPDGVTTIGEDAFQNCVSLASVAIPSSVTNIEDWVFNGCINLASVELPAGLSRLGTAAFQECSKLTTINIPIGVTAISSSTFNLCTNLKDVYYNGTKAQWKKMSVASGNEPLQYATIHYVDSGSQPNPGDPVPNQTYPVSYDFAGGVGADAATHLYKPGSVVTVRTAGVARKGYTFLGWSDGIVTHQAGAQFIMPAHSVVLTALWAKEDVPPVSPNEVFLKQPWGSNTCTLVAATMMLRQRALLDGIDWSTITVDAVRPWAWTVGGLKSSFEYRDTQRGISMAVTRTENIEGRTGNKEYLISMLKKHREGVVVWDFEKPHAVLLTDYNSLTDTFYCADPAMGVPSGKIRLVDSILSGNSDAEIINTLDRVWYIKEYTNIPRSIVSQTFSSNCPVEMQITVNGVTLDSTSVVGTVSNNYAIMSASGSGQERSITATIIGNYALEGNVTVRLLGTDTGNMTFVASYLYTDGTTEEHSFQSVPVTSKTVAIAEDFYPQTTLLLTISNKDNFSLKKVWTADPNELACGPNEEFSNISIDIPTDASYIHIPTTQNGTLTVSKHTAAPGDWVNIYAAPDAGYRLDSLTVTDHRGWPVIVREMGENAFSFTMPAARVTVNAVFTKVEEEVPSPTEDSTTTGSDVAIGSPGYVDVILNPSPMNFTDVSAADWFYNDVRYCWQHYLMTGVSDARFDPQGATNRAMIWTVIARLAGRDTSGGSIWYERGQIWAKNKGITDGADPLADVTREQLVTMLWRFKGSPHVNTDNLLQFKDAADVSGWAVQPVRWAVANGLLNGAFGSLNPQGKATRAEVVAILTRFCQFAG